MKLLLQTFVRIQHYSLLYQPKEMEVVAKDPGQDRKDPGKCASLIKGGRAQEEEIPLRPGIFMQILHWFARFYKSGVIPTESSGI